MMNREQAVKSVFDYIDAVKNDFVIVEEATLEEDFGWVIFYDSRLHHERGLFRYAIAGNAPLIVERNTGRILETGTAYPIEYYLTAYRLTGDPHSDLIPVVEIMDYASIPDTFKFIKAVRKITGIGLSDAKAHIDHLKRKGSVTIPCDTQETARILVKEISALGAKCNVSFAAKC